MSLWLSDSDLQGIERASRLLLSPHDHPTLNAWRSAVNRQLCELLHADSAGFLLPTAEGPSFYSEEHPPANMARFPELLPPDLANGTPIWQRNLALGVCTIGTAYGRDVARYHASPYYNEFARPNGAADTLGASFLLGRLDRNVGPAAASSLHLWRERAGGRHAFGQRSISLLRLLLPAFRAGVEAERRFRTGGASIVAMLDQLGQAAMVCDHQGRVLHRTPALEAVVAADAEGAVIVRAMLRAAMLTLSPAHQAIQAAASVIRTQSASYGVTVSRYTEPARGEPWLLVALAAESRREPTAEELRARYGLTPAEARVALLLARGRSNAQMAEQLAISPFTARRHTERVLAKLRVRSRAEVAARIHEAT